MRESDFKFVEERVTGRAGSYKGIQQVALLTSEQDFLSILSHIPEIQIWVEPGSGLGLGPLLFAKLHPDKKSFGIEFEESRHSWAEDSKRRLRLSNVEFSAADLLESPLPIGDTYFLYFPTGIVLDKMLSELAESRRKIRVIAIESHGDLLPRLRKESWLKEVRQIPLATPRHYSHAVVFEGAGPSRKSLHDISFLKKNLLISDEASSQWLGDSYGLEWLRGDQYNLACPPRTICEGQVKAVLNFDELENSSQLILHLRRLGEVTIETETNNFSGLLRKIFVSPTFKVELSTGQQVEWSQIKKIFWESVLCFDSSLDYYFYPLAV